MKAVSQKIADLDKKVDELDQSIEEIVYIIPNLPDKSVPVGGPEANKIIDSFKQMMLESRLQDVSLPENMEELEALQGVKKYPVRIKCVLLPWNSLMQAIKDVSTGTNGDSHAHIHSKVEMN